jgi:DNA/RNA-binding domain of Phe-tRNA-synthetase-like protein
MKKFIITDEFFEIFPDAVFGIVVIKGADNTKRDAEHIRLLRAAEDESEKYIELDPLSANPVIAVWREAFLRFKTKKGARSSIEALLKRVSKGERIGSISPVVDLYNSVSLKYGMSCGAEDIDTFVGDVLITTADGTESFRLIGADTDDPPLPGEIIYKDDVGAVCRNFNWREAERTMVTDATRNVFSSIELVNKERIDELKAAIAELATLYEKYLGGKAETFLLDKENSFAIITPAGGCAFCTIRRIRTAIFRTRGYA